MSAGGSAGNAENRFERKGTATSTSFRDLTPEHTGLFQQGLSASAPGSANAGLDSMLNNRISAQPGARPYAPELCQVIRGSLPSQKTPGQDNMRTMADRSVYGAQYENGTFNRYAEEVQKAMGFARSGPQATRGGTAASGFAQAQAVNDIGLNREQVVSQNRGMDANIAQGAAGQMAGARNMMSGAAIQGAGQGQQGFYNFLQSQLGAGGLTTDRLKAFNQLVPAYTALDSVSHGTEANDLTGQGAQTNRSMEAGVNLCCFIFLEAYGGKMPAHVRACRDEFAPENSSRRIGYIRMSKWLVPAMRVSVFARKLTNCLLIRPLTKWGEWYQSGEGKEPIVARVVKNTWFKIWELTGK